MTLPRPNPKPRRRVERHDRVVGVDHRDDPGDVEEVPVRVLDDQRKPGLTGVFRVGFGHRARGRRLPHRPVVGAAVVVAGQPEQQQERQRQRRVREPPHVGQDLRPEVAGLRRAARADARRVERRQVVVLGDVVVVLQERPHRRVDDERGEAQVHDQRRLPPPVGAQGALRDLGTARPRKRRSPCGRRWVRSLFPFGVVRPSASDAETHARCEPPTPSSSTSRQKSVSYWVSGIGIFSPTCW